MVDARKWQGFLQSAEQASVVCLACGDDYLLETYSSRLIGHLQQQWQDSEVTVIAGEDFTLEQAVMAAGTISFFSSRRIIRIHRLPLSELSDKDLTEFCELLNDTENAVFIITLCVKNERDKKSKRLKQLENAVQMNGCWMTIDAPRAGDIKAIAVRMAEETGAKINDDAAAMLAERTGTDLYLLSGEVAKLAAGAGYGTITAQTVETLAIRTVEADVFKIIDAVTAGDVPHVFGILDRLLYLRSEPIAIVAALMTGFVDMARVQAGARHRVPYSGVWKDLNYTGNEYRMKYVAQRAARFSAGQIREVLEILAELDYSLKSSPLNDAVLLQTALCEICNLVRTAGT